jgi:hypothetical protein
MTRSSASSTRSANTVELKTLLADPSAHATELRKLLRDPPAKKVNALARGILGLGASYMVRECKSLAPSVIRRVLAERLPLPPRLREDGCITRDLIFLKEAVSLDCDDDDLAKAWRAALEALNAVRTQGVVRDPRFVAPVQAAVVVANPADEIAVRPFLAVLARDGSEASVDALIPHVHHAWSVPGGLDRIHALRLFAAKTPTMDALMAEIEARLCARSAASPPVRLLRELGVEADACAFHVVCSSTRQGDRAQLTVKINSMTESWLYASVEGRDGVTSFTDKAALCDALTLGHVEFSELPIFLARAAGRLGVEWAWKDASVTSPLSKDGRSALLRWLRSG